MLAVVLPLSLLAPQLGFVTLPASFWLILPVLVVAYLVIVEIVKRRLIGTTPAGHVAWHLPGLRT